MSYSQSKMSNPSNRTGRTYTQRRYAEATPVKEEVKKVERPGPDRDPRTGKLDWTRYNETTIGWAPDLRAPAHPICLPGLMATQGPGARPPVYRYLTRADDVPTEWTHVGRKEAKRVRRERGRRRREDANMRRIEIDDADEFVAEDQQEWKGKALRRGGNYRPRTPEYTNGPAAEQEA